MVRELPKHLKITVAGTGYVGLSLSCLLAQQNDVCAIDIVQKKVDLINNGISPIADSAIEPFLAAHPEGLTATTDPSIAYHTDCDYVVIATPTNYDVERNTFDTSSIESVLNEVENRCPSLLLLLLSPLFPLVIQGEFLLNIPSSIYCSPRNFFAKVTRLKTT